MHPRVANDNGSHGAHGFDELTVLTEVNPHDARVSPLEFMHRAIPNSAQSDDHDVLCLWDVLPPQYLSKPRRDDKVRDNGIQRGHSSGTQEHDQTPIEF